MDRSLSTSLLLVLAHFIIIFAHLLDARTLGDAYQPHVHASSSSAAALRLWSSADADGGALAKSSPRAPPPPRSSHSPTPRWHDGDGAPARWPAAAAPPPPFAGDVVGQPVLSPSRPAVYTA
ncbi:Os05g0546100 [Oryza sativa Japonica Group]|uniref:Os05g0546100 protein n=1 Tax=Oryza sativa subsp. japonica TaxID=39947 RepID=A0A0P0WPV9_ORYSJ|nr:hypothetical protein DAI22_05g248050 [Oryza sativa Japonica Group]BAS95167.1 Os05g0546100 [Oryza sativa Japonica Group]